MRRESSSSIWKQSWVHPDEVSLPIQGEVAFHVGREVEGGLARHWWYSP